MLISKYLNKVIEPVKVLYPWPYHLIPSKTAFHNLLCVFRALSFKLHIRKAYKKFKFQRKYYKKTEYFLTGIICRYHQYSEIFTMIKLFSGLFASVLSSNVCLVPAACTLSSGKKTFFEKNLHNPFKGSEGFWVLDLYTPNLSRRRSSII